MVEGALEVVENALCDSEMGLTRVVHLKAHLLNIVGNVKPGEGEVVEVSIGMVQSLQPLMPAPSRISQPY
jgi:hypothetical protein